MLDIFSHVKVEQLLSTAMPILGGAGYVRTPLHDPLGSSHEKGLCETTVLLPLPPGTVCIPLALL